VINPVNPESETSDDINPPIVPAVAVESQKAGFLSTFLSTFITIFLAEMGDKTQLATLLMTAQSQSPWIVFAGAGSALIATSLVGVLLGRYLSKVLSPKTLDIAAGMLLMVISILLLGDVVAL
jgi:Ca2+/H+ antiporter, TMEM165/GDT1 family